MIMRKQQSTALVFYTKVQSQNQYPQYFDFIDPKKC